MTIDHATLDLSMVAGEDKSWSFFLDQPPGNDLVLTGYTEALFTVNDRWGGTRVLQKNIASGVVLTDPLTGNITVTLLEADTGSLVFHGLSERLQYVYEVRLTDASGLDYVPVRGKLTIWRAAS